MSAEVVVALTRDTTPPRVVHVTPIPGRVLAVGSVANLSVLFNEAMNPATLTAATIQLIYAGADGQIGTADDAPVLGGVVAYQAQSRTASLSLGKALAPGLYQAVVTTGVTDQAGNALAAPYSWNFRVFLADVSGGQTITGNGAFDGSGGQDVYTFTASAGQAVYFDAQSGDNCTTRSSWRCADATGAVLFDQKLGCHGPVRSA